VNSPEKVPNPAQHRTAGSLRDLMSRFRSMRLSTRAILFNIGLTTFVITAVFVTLSIEIRSETKQLLRDMLNRSEKQVLSIQQDNLSQLLWASSQISANPTLRAAMETYRLEPDLRVPVRSELLATIQNELDKIWAGLRHDLLFVTNEAGVVLAANGQMDVQPQPGEDLSGLPVLNHALDPSVAVGEKNFGVINLQGQYYLIGTLPIEMQGYLIGSLSLGDLIDSSFLPNLRAFLGGETVVTVGHRIIASTLPESSRGGSGLENLARLGTASVRPDGTASLGAEEYLVTSMKLGTDDTGHPVTLFLLRSLTKALQQPNAKLKNTLATQAFLAIFLGALLTWTATRASLRPLERFVTFMKGVAESGDYSRRFRGRLAEVNRPDPESLEKNSTAELDTQSHNELDLLVSGFNNMLAVIETREASLKKAHTELEQGVLTLKQKEEELRQAQKMEAIGLLAGGVAHDFNNILTVVSGFSELALRSLEAGHDARGSIEEVQKACKSASLLTRQLLAFSRKQVFRPKIINLNDLIRGLENLLRSVVGESISLTTRLEVDLYNVMADPTQIEQVLLNLTLNSRDAIESNGRISIETANFDPDDTTTPGHGDFLKAPHAVITFSDTGCGMNEETLARIFEPFFTTKEKGKGTGLGLSTVHGIIKQSGGHIRVFSEPARGTTFRIYVPQETRVAGETQAAVQSGFMTGSETILVVEDEPVVRKMVCQSLTMNGFEVVEASGPVEALKLFEARQDKIDLLITDVIMPVMDGGQLYEQIAQLDPGIKALFISGYTNGVIDEGGILADGVNFLQKPFEPETLWATVRKILNNAK